MAQQVCDLVDGTPMPDKLRCQAMAHQVGASDTGKRNPALLQCRLHDPRDDAAAINGAHGRDMLQEDPLAVVPRSGMQDILGKRRPRFL